MSYLTNLLPPIGPLWNTPSNWFDTSQEQIGREITESPGRERWKFNSHDLGYGFADYNYLMFATPDKILEAHPGDIDPVHPPESHPGDGYPCYYFTGSFGNDQNWITPAWSHYWPGGQMVSIIRVQGVTELVNSRVTLASLLGASTYTAPPVFDGSGQIVYTPATTPSAHFLTFEFLNIFPGGDPEAPRTGDQTPPLVLNWTAAPQAPGTHPPGVYRIDRTVYLYWSQAGSGTPSDNPYLFFQFLYRANSGTSPYPYLCPDGVRRQFRNVKKAPEGQPPFTVNTNIPFVSGVTGRSHHQWVHLWWSGCFQSANQGAIPSGDPAGQPSFRIVDHSPPVRLL